MLCFHLYVSSDAISPLSIVKVEVLFEVSAVHVHVSGDLPLTMEMFTCNSKSKARYFVILLLQFLFVSPRLGQQAICVVLLPCASRQRICSRAIQQKPGLWGPSEMFQPARCKRGQSNVACTLSRASFACRTRMIGNHVLPRNRKSFGHRKNYPDLDHPKRLAAMPP